MTAEREDSPVVREILAGERPELKRLAAEGLAPLALDELLELQVRLTTDEDPEISRLAADSLKDTDPQVLAHAIEDTASRRVVDYLGHHSESAEVQRAVLGRRGVAPATLAAMAARLADDLQEQLLLRQDVIVEHPEILTALEGNPSLTPFARRRISEYRQHMPGAEADEVPEEPSDEPEEEEPEEQLEEALQARVDAIRKIYEEAAKGEFGDLPEDVARLTAAQIRQLPTPARLALCRRAPRALRMILIRDQHPEVPRALMRLNRLTEDEVDKIVKSRTVIVDVLEAIALDRTWARRYTVAHQLVKNPKTPLAIAMRFLSRLTVRHLRDALRDRNLPEAIRIRAKQLYTIKTR